MNGVATGGNQHRPVVGRTRELEAFRAAFDHMLAGRRGLVLEGLLNPVREEVAA